MSLCLCRVTATAFHIVLGTSFPRQTRLIQNTRPCMHPPQYQAHLPIHYRDFPPTFYENDGAPYQFISVKCIAFRIQAATIANALRLRHRFEFPLALIRGGSTACQYYAIRVSVSRAARSLQQKGQRQNSLCTLRARGSGFGHVIR